ncbi:unnamed protein product [Linum tenue]|uniref:Cystatin domain-containing protein n=1 Tax=Linum tenue TaxID=586396 RepID=A0AAV0QMB6_9ROSI|nr:unnamed protein product [Linum tenue]
MDTAPHDRSSESGYVEEEGKSEPLPTRSGSSPDESQLGSDSKRQKFEESDDALKKIYDTTDDESVEAEEEEDDDDSSDDSYSDPAIYPQDEEGKKQLKIYFQSIVDSEGYDVAECPLKMVGPDHGYLRVHLDDHEDYHASYVVTCVNHVIREQNKKGAEMTLRKIENATSMKVNGYNYYITFSAETGPKKENKVYQAQVYCSFLGEVIKITNFREKQQPKSSGTRVRVLLYRTEAEAMQGFFAGLGEEGF